MLNAYVAEIMPENTGMRRVCTKLGFSFSHIEATQNLLAEIHLAPENHTVPAHVEEPTAAD